VKILLDPHALLWYALDDPRLSKPARSEILTTTNEVHVSPATYWELAIKISLGKLAMHQPFQRFLDACENEYGFHLLPILAAHASRVATLAFPVNHRDPFDRLIIAQAIVEEMAVVTIDPAFNGYPVTCIW
jgi:PIN domain nuclease of toxin-antitoxin system